MSCNSLSLWDTSFSSHPRVADLGWLIAWQHAVLLNIAKTNNLVFEFTQWGKQNRTCWLKQASFFPPLVAFLRFGSILASCQPHWWKELVKKVTVKAKDQPCLVLIWVHWWFSQKCLNMRNNLNQIKVSAATLLSSPTVFSLYIEGN